MNKLTIEKVVITIRKQGKIRWFRSDRNLWVLDVNRWRDDFINAGYKVPIFANSYRFGIHQVNQETAEAFLDNMKQFEIEKCTLSKELARRFTTAESWWDVKDLFPIMFVDFDSQKVGAFYLDGTPMERYMPEGWEGEFIDFANDYPESIFPKKEKFWAQGNVDLLKILNERGEKQ